MQEDTIARLKEEEKIFINQQSREMLNVLYGYEPITDTLYFCLVSSLTELKCYILLNILNENFVACRQPPFIYDSLRIE